MGGAVAMNLSTGETRRSSGEARHQLLAKSPRGESLEGRLRGCPAGLANVVKPGGKVFLACFSDEEPGTQGPRRVTQRELREAFAKGWHVESIRPVRFEVLPNLKDLQFSEAGPKAWFAVIRRQP